MPNISDIRAQYPQYSDLSDEELAHGLHDKFYADMPYEDFAAKIGLQTRETAMQGFARGAKNALGDLYRGGTALAALPLDVLAGAHNLATRAFYPGGYDVTVNGQKVHRTGEIPSASALREEAMAQFGMRPDYRSPAEEVIGSATRATGGVLSTLGAGSLMSGLSGTVGNVGRTLASQPIPQLVAGASGGASSDIARQLGGNRFVQFLAGLGGGMAGGLATQAMMNRAPVPVPPVLKEARQEGMVVPPAQINPKSGGAMIEGMAGTLKTGQAAAAKNQPIVDSLAARAVGVSDEALSPELLQSIRNQAGEAYRVLRNVGRVTTDDQFLGEVNSAVKPYRTVQGNFPSLANKQIIAIADDIARKSFDADAAVDAIKMLRDNSSVAYRAGESGLGGAYKSMANAFEGTIQRYLEKQGASGAATLTAFKEARQLIAKTHTIENALNGSHVDIHALKRMLNNGVPLTGELKMLGQFAQEYPGASNLLRATQTRPAYSPLDWWTGLTSIGGAAATGRPELALPALYSAARPGLRNLILSNMMQNRFANPTAAQFQVPATGLLGATVPIMEPLP